MVYSDMMTKEQLAALLVFWCILAFIVASLVGRIFRDES